MNAINRAATSVFDVVLTPFEALGAGWALFLVSGAFGILCLVLFKQISWQKGIKATKDKIKGNMIAIRLYQDDLRIVGTSVLKVLARNVQYLTLNFGPILPLVPPMVLVAAQFVVRYGFDPIPLVESEQELARLLPGEGTLIEVAMKPGSEAKVASLEIALPRDQLRAVSPLVRSIADGKAFQEVVAIGPGTSEIELRIDGQRAGSKEVVTGGQRQRRMQPERVSSFWSAWLWPAEDTFAADSPLARVAVPYPERDLGIPLLPAGPLGILLAFFLATIVFGVAVLKPLNIQI
jgi:hypothetical protein